MVDDSERKAHTHTHTLLVVSTSMVPDNVRKCRRSIRCYGCGHVSGPCGGHKNRKRSLKQPPSRSISILIVVFHTLLISIFFPKDHQTFAAILIAMAATSSSSSSSSQTPTPTPTIRRVDLVKPGGFVAGVNLVTSNVPVPVPTTQQNDNKKNEVLIDVKASAVNPVDWKQATYNFFLPPDGVSTSQPAALGCDVAGIVIAPSSSPLFGKNVVTYLGADKSKTMATRGGFTEQVLADEDLVFELPSSPTPSRISFSDAATLPVGGLTAGLLLEGIEPAKNKEANNDNWIVIWGTSSSVGWFALQLAKQDGYKVIAIASSTHKDSAIALGADAFIDYRQEEDIVGAVTKIVLEQDGNISMNAAIDCIGTEDTFSKCCDIVNKFSPSSGSGSTKLVSCTNFGPDGPDGVKRVAVNLGTANETNRDFVKSYFPKRLFGLKPQPTKLVKSNGPVDAKIVEHAFQLSQNGVSGEKIVIEWD